MKLVTYCDAADAASSAGAGRAGVLVGDRIIDLAEGFRWLEQSRGPGGKSVRPEAIVEKYGRGVLGFIECAREARPAADALVAAMSSRELPETLDGARLFRPAGSAKLLAPVPRPPSMRDAYSFRQHVETARRNRGLEMIPEFDQFPVFYFTNHQSVIGPGELRVQSRHLARLDFELEAAIVLGKHGKNVPAARADELVFGLTIMNDFSARALQMDEMKLSLGPAKGKDFATGLGPWLVTLDELAPRTRTTEHGLQFDLEMRAFVNDVQVSKGSVADMTWSFAQILERASYGVMLHPGEVIGSGTCGTGCFLELNGSKITRDQWLNPGDRVALEIEGLGRLEHVVVQTEDAAFVQ
jgi:fumarylacetoacetate (FAA) hydrolase